MGVAALGVEIKAERCGFVRCDKAERCGFVRCDKAERCGLKR